jgi:hypothetical protein
MGPNEQLKWLSLIAFGVMVAGCERDSLKQPVENQPADAVAPRPALPVPEPPFDRPALLRTVAQVASAAGLGKSSAEEQRRLDGKPFEFRIRFGCSTEAGEPIEEAAFGVRFDPDKRTLRLRAEPNLTPASPGMATLAGPEVEAVEGFWIRRPWLLVDGCPAAPQLPEPQGDAANGDQSAAVPPPPVQPAQRVGLASFFTESDSRTGRRDRRPYEVTKVLETGESPSAQGYNLVLSGRLRAAPQGQVVNCQVTGRDSPPQCVITAQFDRVWIEHPVFKDVLAEWSK